MMRRIVIVTIALFWAVMNILLWREEFGGGRSAAAVPVETVWQRILTAPDHSNLLLRHQGRKLGVFRWAPTVVESRPDDQPADNELAQEGMITTTAGYTLDLDGNFGGEGFGGRLRLFAHLQLATNQAWQEFSVRLIQKPTAWEVSASAGADALQFKWEEGDAKWEQNYRFRDFANPQKLLGDYALLIPPGLLPARMFSATNAAALKPVWTARHDTLKLGRSRVRVFRLSTRLLNRYDVVVHVSRAGEILKVQLPDQLSLANEAMPNL